MVRSATDRPLVNSQQTEMTLGQFVHWDAVPEEMTRIKQRHPTRVLRRNKESAARQRRMTSFSRDPMFVIPAPYSGRPVCVGLVGMKRYQGAEDGCFLQKKSDTTSCLRSISLAKYLNSSVGLLESSRPFFSSTGLK